MTGMLRAITRTGRRLAASALAIALGVAFTCATLLLGSSLEHGYADRVAGWIGDAAVVVQPATVLEPDAVASLAGVPGVTSVDPRVDHWTVFDDDLYARVRTQPELGAHTRLVSGRLADAPGELVVNESFASAGRVELGSTLTALEFPADPPAGGSGAEEAGTEEAGAPEPLPGPSFTVVGVLASGHDTSDGPSFPEAYAPSEHLLDLAGGYRIVLVSGTEAPDVLADRLAALPSLGDEGTDVLTAAAYTAKEIDQYTQGTQATTSLLLTFSVIAFAVTALVIANTFGILVAQRTRQLALLRCVGASRGQVFRQVLAEAAVTAALAGVAGVTLGVGLVAVLPLTLPQLASYTAVAPTAVGLLAPWLTGIVVTVAAAAVPARAATRVPPLAALRPTLAASGTRAVGRGRLAAGALLTAAGAGLLVFAVQAFQLPAGLAGGVGSFVGVLLLGPVIVPALANAAARPWRAGVVGRLASENIARNPHRSATTAGALLIGTTLVTMVLVGAATGQATTTAALDRRHPADALIQGDVTAATQRAAEGVPGLAAAVLAAMEDVTIAETGAPGSANSTVVAMDAGGVAALGWDGVAGGLADDVVVLPRSLGLADGSTVSVSARGRTVELTVRVVPQAGFVAVTPATLARISPDARPVLLVRWADGTDHSAALGNLRDVMVPDGVWLSSAAEARASIADAVAIALQVVLGLLAVSVAISWVGVGNTLGLSVLERSRETALLRALGLERGQVRRLLGAEALLMGAIAAVLGVGLGVGYGLAGVAVLLGERMPLAVAIPWWQVAAVGAVTLGSAWLASVLPGVRAARVAPAAALAED